MREVLCNAAARLPAAPVTRFAPSPTGYLHLGHVANAIWVWGVARMAGGRVVLRVEDHDRIRSRPAFTEALLEDLDWLGFTADAGRHPPVRQSERGDRYREALARLRRSHHVYACACSRRDIGGERYAGRCRHLDLADSPGHGLRLRIDAGEEVFDDVRLGRLAQSPADDCGDLLLRDRDGHWTYQFAVTVDDLCDDITLVIRGEDLAGSTGRQLRLARLLGRAVPPLFLHHPLIVGPDGEKLSKSRGDTGVRELRAQGLGPADVIGLAAAASGLTPSPAPLPATDVPRLFAAEPLRPSPRPS